MIPVSQVVAKRSGVSRGNCGACTWEASSDGIPTLGVSLSLFCQELECI